MLPGDVQICKYKPDKPEVIDGLLPLSVGDICLFNRYFNHNCTEETPDILPLPVFLFVEVVYVLFHGWNFN